MKACCNAWFLCPNFDGLMVPHSLALLSWCISMNIFIVPQNNKPHIYYSPVSCVCVFSVGWAQYITGETVPNVKNHRSINLSTPTHLQPSSIGVVLSPIPFLAP